MPSSVCVSCRSSLSDSGEAGLPGRCRRSRAGRGIRYASQLRAAVTSARMPMPSVGMIAGYLPVLQVDAGVSAYVVDGLKKERVKPILDMAISRFNAFSRMERELEEARTELESRKTVERAKGILMKSRGLSEQEAYSLLRKTAMNQNRKISDVAQALVTTAGLLGAGDEQ